MANPSEEEQKAVRRLESARERLAAATPRSGGGPLTPEQERELTEAKAEVTAATRALKGVVNDIESSEGRTSPGGSRHTAASGDDRVVEADED
jgi:hypothetical protein